MNVSHSKIEDLEALAMEYLALNGRLNADPESVTTKELMEMNEQVERRLIRHLPGIICDLMRLKAIESIARED